MAETCTTINDKRFVFKTKRKDTRQKYRFIRKNEEHPNGKN